MQVIFPFTYEVLYQEKQTHEEGYIKQYIFPAGRCFKKAIIQEDAEKNTGNHP